MAKNKRRRWNAATRNRTSGRLASQFECLEAAAREMQSQAVSHSGKHVGAAALAAGARGKLILAYGANFKPEPGPRKHDEGVHYCAEMQVIRGVKTLQCKRIICMTVIGPPQADDASGREQGVLLSCAYCRQVYREELANPKSPLKKDTLLRFVDPEGRVRSMTRTVGGFLSLFSREEDQRYIREQRGGR